ncbi:MAG: hypothetical protein ACP5C4_06065 [Methanomicrobiales archaeon]
MRELALFYSILLVSLAGALKLRFAYAFLGMEIPLAQFGAAALIACSAYALDRGMENKEDERHRRAVRKLLIAGALACIIGSFILFPNPALIIPLGLAYLYTRGIGGHRLKGGFGIKNGVVALTWSLGLVIFMHVFTISSILLYLFFFFKSFVNTVIYDVRDIDRDRIAGILTLPALFSPGRLRLLLVGVNVATHGSLLWAFFAGWFQCGDVLALSAIHSTAYICAFCRRHQPFRDTLVDGEWVLYEGYTILRAFLL